MLFSGSSALVFWIAALGSATATFVKGDFGDLCRAVGVTGIVLSQRTNFNRFLAKLISQVYNPISLHILSFYSYHIFY